MPPSSLVAPIGYSRSTCNYCDPSLKLIEKKTSCTYGAWAYDLSPYEYQDLIDSNWRRSGLYLYKPDNLRTCCAHLTIRLKAEDYRPGKQQRRSLARLYWDVRGAQRPSKKKGKDNAKFGLPKRWAQIESTADEVSKVANNSQMSGSNRITKCLKTSLVPSTFTAEKYSLFRRYQIAIHSQSPGDVSSEAGFTRFLVDSPIRRMLPTASDTSTEEAVPYGSYHHEYRLDDKLIAVGVLDILPHCVSSVYLFYDPAFSHLNLGTISAMREILLVQQLQQRPNMQDLEFYYLGYYIHDCQKMKYKSQYKPSELLDLRDGTWRHFDSVKPALDRGVRFDFNSSTAAFRDHGHRKYSVEGPATPSSSIPSPAPPGFLDLSAVANPSAISQWANIFVIDADAQEQGAQPLLVLPYVLAGKMTSTAKGAKACNFIAATGFEIVSRCILFLIGDDGN
ncbi:hypothetical protein K437DRAFT_238121, partial [Tilletiaria anomala UBC 951]